MQLNELFLLEAAISREVDVPSLRGGDTVVAVNPSPSSMARLLAQGGPRSILRALADTDNFAAWNSEDALHEPVRRVLPEFSGGSRHYFMFARRGAPEKNYPYRVGAYAVSPRNDISNAVLPDKFLPGAMKRALGSPAIRGV